MPGLSSFSFGCFIVTNVDSLCILFRLLSFVFCIALLVALLCASCFALLCFAFGWYGALLCFSLCLAPVAGFLGGTLAALGLSWAALGPLGDAFGPLLATLGPLSGRSWRLLAAFGQLLAALGPLLAALGSLFAALGLLLAALGLLLGTSWRL